MLTELEAWKAAKKAYSNAPKKLKPYSEQPYGAGLCRFFTRLRDDRLLSVTTLTHIQRKIKVSLKPKQVYLAPYSGAGARIRVRFCNEQIKKLSKHK